MPRWRKFMRTWDRAVVIRDAPGVPTASTDPSGRRATVGAMFDAILVPGSRLWKPSAINSTSPRELFIQRPVPGTIAPEP
jgi:hypothetical protein